MAYQPTRLSRRQQGSPPEIDSFPTIQWWMSILDTILGTLEVHTHTQN